MPRRGEELLTNALQKQIPIALGEVPTANALAEEHVAANDDVLSEKMKAQAARAVPRDMVDVHGRSE